MGRRADSHDLEVCGTERRNDGSLLYGAAIGLLYVALATFNLIYPAPRGLADQGDFHRLFAAFSSGPKDLPFFPEPSDPQFQARFSRYYLRFWRIGDAHKDWAHQSSSHLVYH